MNLSGAISSAPRDAIAAIDETGRVLTYAELNEAAALLASELGPEPRLVVLEGGNSIAWLIAYAACLRARHPALIAPAGNGDALAALEEAFAPAVRLLSANSYHPVDTGRRGAPIPHPDLAIMLSTSGSTGSAKCVRLSHDNLAANAASIVEYLHIGADERGVVSLPTHYSYGLSIVNSHLMAGACLLLTGASVIDPGFWTFCETHGATSFAGVPHSYDLLERLGLSARAPATLRYFTQAGGRLSPRAAERFAALAAEHGWRFYVMYGQTEATARMAYMPPELIASHPDRIGVPIPGGRFTLVGPEGRTIEDSGVEGELVYEGPNVMMGYATGPPDLALAAGPSRLPTGDIAERGADGLYRITGRLSRFIKIFGNRIGLDDVERLIGAEGHDAIATGIDDKLLLVTRDSSATAGIEALALRKLKLPNDYFEDIRVVEEYPLTPSGKLDYPSLKATLRPAGTHTEALLTESGGQGVADAFVAMFGKQGSEEDASFNSLGGDSLHYVSMVTALERYIPSLPEDWDTLSVGALVQLAEQSQGAELHPSARRYLPRNLDSVRGLACALVVAFHVVGGTPDEGLRLPPSSDWNTVMGVLDLVRMPLFTAMAGFLYGAMPARRYGWPSFIGRKLRQLIIPMLFATLVFWGLFVVAYHRDDSLFWAYILGYRHLWYLDALFLIFALVGGLDVIRPLGWRTLAALTIAVPLLYPAFPRLPLLHVKNAVEFLPFFTFGLLLYRAPEILESRPVLFLAPIVAIALLALSVVPLDGVFVLDSFPILRWVCGMAAIIALLRLFPKLVPLERLAAYSFTIYLWHPAANGLVRAILLKAGVHDVPVLFVIGLIAGLTFPVALHLFIQRFPRLSLPVIGR